MCLVILSVVILVVVQSFWKKRASDLLNPDWDGLSRRLGGVLIPRPLKALYANHRLILEQDFSIIDRPELVKKRGEVKLTRKAKIAARVAGHGVKVWGISRFQPAHPSSVQNLGLPESPAKMFVLASSQFGDQYFMILSVESDADSAVYVAYYDSDGKFDVVAPSLATFLSWDRKRFDHRTRTVSVLEHP